MFEAFFAKQESRQACRQIRLQGKIQNLLIGNLFNITSGRIENFQHSLELVYSIFEICEAPLFN